MFFLSSIAISCGNLVVVDGISDIQQLPPTSLQCLNVHQSWKTAEVPEKYHRLQATWHHKDVRHVLWTDKGNLDLIEHYYPRWSSHYAQLLALPSASGGAVMASDWARLLYLHRFGGLYVDLDYEAHVPPTEWPIVLQSRDDAAVQTAVYFVNSPFLITEVMQNSLMYAPRPGNPFFMHVGRSIQNTLDFIEHPFCPNDSGRDGAQVSANCPLTGAFTNRWTMSVTWLMKTEQITGPPVLDKTYTQLALSGSPDITRVFALSTSDYFGSVGSNSIGPGRYATHWHANSWVTLNPVRLMPTLSLTVILTLLGLLGLAFYIGKHERVYRSKCMRS